MMQRMLKHALLLISPFILAACQKTGSTNLNPSKSSDWELVEKFEGHQKEYTERFELNGNKALIAYEAKSSQEWTHSLLKVFVGKGDEVAWENAEVVAFNQTDAEGTTFFEKPKGSYLLHIKPLEVHYHIKIYQKKGASEGEIDQSQSSSSEGSGGH